jgi:putative DNA methylase
MSVPPIRRKLIEVALPLEAINAASARKKAIRHGHPSTLHLWWARRPLAACGAVLFFQLVDDPSSWPERFPTEAAQPRGARRMRPPRSGLSCVVYRKSICRKVDTWR